MSTEEVAIVTGSNKGLGFAIVKGLCEQYAGVVYLTSRDEKRGVEACKELESIGLKPMYHQLDITDQYSTAKFYNHIKNAHGKFNLLINNAGILFLKDAEESRQYQIEQTMSVNFFSVVKFTETMLPLIKNGGKIINISSSSGHLSRIPSVEIRKKLMANDLSLDELCRLMKDYMEAAPESNDLTEQWGDSPYVVSKVGVNAYTFLLHRKLESRDIACNCVHPGYVRSGMTQGAGNVSPEAGAAIPLQLALQSTTGGQYMWHDGTAVPWDGPDPRGYIDRKKL